jgi:hypothetical protein
MWTLDENLVAENMQNFLTSDDRQAQIPGRSSALWFASLPTFGAAEMSGQVASAAHEGELRFAYAARRASFSKPRSLNCVIRSLERVGRLIARLAPLMAGVALLLAPAGLQAATLTTTQTLTADISPEGGLFSFPNTVTLANAGTTLSNFAGSLSIQYRERTTQSTGGGSITVKATADFTPTGGPSMASPPSTGDALSYTCSGATLGTNCSGTQTVSTSTATNVVTFSASECTGGGGSCSSSSPNTVTVNFTLTDDPKYHTGSYSATLTFTISAS